MRCTLAFLALLPTLLPAQVHKVPVSEGWFPANAAELDRVLDRSFRTARARTGEAPPRKQLLGLIAPHAALSYSGAIAAAAYSRLDHPKNVILLALNHQRLIQGVAAPALDAYRTPLGEVRVNREAVRSLGFRVEPEARLCDHSLENQLPFVQRAAPGAAVIPLYVGELSDAELARAAAKLASRLKQGDVIIASSDLTHYGAAYQYTPFPDDAQLPARLRERAIEIFERIGALDVHRFDNLVTTTHDNLCGWAPIRLLMAAMARRSEEVYASPIDYMASGELGRDYNPSVGYGALAFYPASAFAVSAADQEKLLASARSTLDRYVATSAKTRVPVSASERSRDLEQRGPLFVTVKKNGELRGCIGTFAPRVPLSEAVAGQTLLALSDDPRFPAVSAREGPLSLEISLLTPLKRIGSWRDYRPGHGAVILLDGKSGTLLPQVAEEMHWNREQFLENLARKAGLPAQAYRDSRASLYVYSAQVFAEGPRAVPVSAAGGR